MYVWIGYMYAHKFSIGSQFIDFLITSALHKGLFIVYCSIVRYTHTLLWVSSAGAVKDVIWRFIVLTGYPITPEIDDVISVQMAAVPADTVSPTVPL